MQKLKSQAQTLKTYILDNTPEHELGSTKLFENELIDPLATAIFDIVQVYTGFWPKLYG